MTSREGGLRRTPLILAGLLLAALALLQPGAEPGSAELAPSTFLSSPGGARALYLVAEQLGVRVERWRRPVERLPAEPDAGGFAVLSPAEGMTRAEAEILLDWVGHGGRLLYVPPRQGRDQLLVALDVERASTAGAHDAELAPALDTLGRRLSAGEPQRVTGLQRWLVLGEGGGEPLLVAASDAGEDLLPNSYEHHGERLLGAALLRHERGHIMLLADVAPLVNRSLGSSGLAPLLLRGLAWLGDGSRVLVDEYHHGYDEQAGLAEVGWEFLATTPLGWSVLSLLALVLVGLLSAGARLGAPILSPPRAAPSSLEHVAALAAAWRAAGERRVPSRRLLEGLGGRGDAAGWERLGLLAARVPALADAVATIGAASRGEGDDPVAVAAAVDAVLAHEGLAPASNQGARHRRPAEAAHA